MRLRDEQGRACGALRGALLQLAPALMIITSLIRLDDVRALLVTSLPRHQIVSS